MSSGGAAILGVRTLCSGRYLELQEMSWRTGKGLDHKWERAARRGGVGSVVMIARMVPSNRIILVRQFRPPVEGEVLEFPAGLVERDEDPAGAALRELEEETGYKGRVVRMMYNRANCPGMISENTSIALMEVDETLPENKNPCQKLEGSEELSVCLVSPSELSKLALETRAADPAIEAKLSVLVLGMGWGKES